MLVAPPGYGKSVCAAQWLERTDVASVWMSVDLLDRDPTSFWSHIVVSLRQLLPTLGGEPELVLAELGGCDPAFLGVLAAELDRVLHAAGAETPVVLVVDDVTSVTDRSVFSGLALLAERFGGHLRMIVTGRSDPPFPLASWRTRGTLVEVREADLRFNDDEALDLADRSAHPSIGADTIRQLNERVAGWPMGLHLTMLASSGAHDPDATARRFVVSDRVLSDYVASAVLATLPADQVGVLLRLSVLDAIDEELCVTLCGSALADVAAELAQHGVLLTEVEDRPGVARFHGLLRDLLERELRHRDPERWRELHTRASATYIDRGDLNSAYRHLLAIGDRDGANALVVTPVFELVNSGDHDGLVTLLSSLPPDLTVTHPSLALDVAVAWFFAGRPDEMRAWCGRAEVAAWTAVSPEGTPDVGILQRLHTMRAAGALMDGDLELAHEHVVEHVALESQTSADDQIGRRFATVGMRLMLESGRLADAEEWSARLALVRDPPVVANVTRPALTAWHQLELGNLAAAVPLAEAAVAWVEAHGARPHHGSLDALVVAARCRLAAGDLDGAAELAEAARADAEVLRYRWNLVRVTVLGAEIRRLQGRPQPALEMIRDLRVRLPDHLAVHLSRMVDLTEASVLVDSGRQANALRGLDTLPDSPRRRLVLARALLGVGDAGADEIGEALGDWSRWSLPLRLEAAAISAIVAHDPAADLSEALETAARSGWVSPFLGLGPRVELLLDRLALERLHPALARRRPGRTRPVLTTFSEPLTEREESLLALLPTHLSYAQIGTQLYLSVNTVKTNLKAVYRKLGASSRSEAVDIARRHSLL